MCYTCIIHTCSSSQRFSIMTASVLHFNTDLDGWAEEISETLVFITQLWNDCLPKKISVHSFVVTDSNVTKTSNCLKSYMLSSFKVDPKPLPYFYNHYSCQGLCQQAYTRSSPLCTIINNNIMYKTMMKQSSIHSYTIGYLPSSIYQKWTSHIILIHYLFQAHTYTLRLYTN
jgi:hypothetical protein